jgi:hypothetical protein
MIKGLKAIKMLIDHYSLTEEVKDRANELFSLVVEA